MRTSGGADEMDNVVKFPAAPEWARTVDAKLLDRLIAKGYLRPVNAVIGAPSRWRSTAPSTRPCSSPDRN